MFIITGQLKPKQNLHHIWGGHDVLPSPRSTFFFGGGGGVSPLSPAGFTPLTTGGGTR